MGILAAVEGNNKLHDPVEPPPSGLVWSEPMPSLAWLDLAMTDFVLERANEHFQTALSHRNMRPN